MLRRYWISFTSIEKSSPLNLGCGVTAKTKDEAMSMVRDWVFPLFGEGEFANVVEDIEIDSLDQGHILPNIGNPAVSGVWFPAI
jgi:hypothetical protein